MKHRQLKTETLGREECLALMGSVALGRVVFTDQALPAVQAVGFVLDDDKNVIVGTEPGSKLANALRGAIVAFEADDIRSATGAGWSVTVVGQARAVTFPADRARLATLPLRSWPPGVGGHFIRIFGDQVTGTRATAPSTLIEEET